MSWLLDLHLIRFFGFYLAVFFLLSTVLRLRQYQTFAGLVRSMPQRWPRLLQLVREHGHIFLTWGTVLPLLIVFVLFLANTLASNYLWPRADYTVSHLLRRWPALLVVVPTAAAMLAVDLYGCWSVGTVNRHELEQYFDQAEYWLRSWTAPVVRLFTLGYINPRQMVAVEVRAALLSASRLLNSALWWVSLQTGLRIACGLALWGTYILDPWLARLTGT